MAKLAREQAVRERRARKDAKKEDKKLLALQPPADADGTLADDGAEDETDVE